MNAGTNRNRGSRQQILVQRSRQGLSHSLGTAECHCLAFAVGADQQITAAVLPDLVRHLGDHRQILGAQLGGARSEQHAAQLDLHGLSTAGHELGIEIHAEVKAHRHTGSDAAQQRIAGRELGSCRQGGRIHLEDEVATALPAAAIDAGQVIAAEQVGLDQQAFHRCNAHAGNAAFINTCAAQHIDHAKTIGFGCDATLHLDGRGIASGCSFSRFLDRSAARGIHAHGHALLVRQHKVIGEVQAAQLLADDHHMLVDGISLRLAGTDSAQVQPM